MVVGAGEATVEATAVGEDVPQPATSSATVTMTTAALRESVEPKSAPHPMERRFLHVDMRKKVRCQLPRQTPIHMRKASFTTSPSPPKFQALLTSISTCGL